MLDQRPESSTYGKAGMTYLVYFKNDDKLLNDPFVFGCDENAMLGLVEKTQALIVKGALITPAVSFILCITNHFLGR